MIEKTTDIEYLNKLSSYNITLNAFSNVLIYKENKILGFIDFNKMYDAIEINYIYVIPEARGNKIASKLISYLINNYDFKNITLEVNVNNKIAINLYKKYNFKIINIRKKYYGDADGYLMEVKK